MFEVTMIMMAVYNYFSDHHINIAGLSWLCKSFKINLDKVIWPACLPARGEEYNLWRDSEVQGWGSTSTTGWNSGGGDDEHDGG